MVSKVNHKWSFHQQKTISLNLSLISCGNLCEKKKKRKKEKQETNEVHLECNTNTITI